MPFASHENTQKKKFHNSIARIFPRLFHTQPLLFVRFLTHPVVRVHSWKILAENLFPYIVKVLFVLFVEIIKMLFNGTSFSSNASSALHLMYFRNMLWKAFIWLFSMFHCAVRVWISLICFLRSMANHDSCELGVGGWIYASSIASKGSLRTENNEGRIYTAERGKKHCCTTIHWLERVGGTWIRS